MGLVVPSFAGEPWIASPEILSSRESASNAWVEGTVFEDLNGDGRQQAGESGLSGVLVSNGLDVTPTDAGGRYRLAVRPDMNLMVVQPAGWQVPVDERMIPQFHYVHKELGSEGTLRFGGLPPTGPMPAAVNFPLRRLGGSASFKAAVIGDSQTYSNTEIGYLRDSMVADLLAETKSPVDFMLYLGDVVGDDLGLLDRLVEVGSAVGVPQWLVHGNHDVDFDARRDADSTDTWRRIFGPQYYAFEAGQVTFVVMDNVVYPCGSEDQVLPGREFCDQVTPTYNGRIPTEQMIWLENLLAAIPRDRLVVLATHIPFVSFADPTSRQHQTDNVLDLYRLVDGRQALSLSGHTHTLENHAPGQVFEGWEEAVGVAALPFRHIIAGAASGSWYQGDFDIFGIPMSLQRLGAPKGVLLMDFDGTDYAETYRGAGMGPDRAMWLGVNTPAFRDWYETLEGWMKQPASVRREGLPPLSINDLPDTKCLIPADLQEGAWITANVWAGSAESRVTLRLNNEAPRVMERSQSGTGEPVRVGAEWADPFAAQRQLAVARYAYASTSGIERNQGVEVTKGRRFGPAAPQPMPRLADRNMHLWRYRLPADLPAGVYRAQVDVEDRAGRLLSESFVFEVRADRPVPRWRAELWK